MGMKEIFEQNTADIMTATEMLKELADREGQYVWKKLTAEGGDFIDYVVADDEASYPDGALGDDGYWYELFDPTTLISENIREGIDIWGIIGSMSEGVSGIDYGEVTITASAFQITVNHNLKKKPTGVMIYSPKNEDHTLLVIYPSARNSTNSLIITSTGIGSTLPTITEELVTFNCATSFNPFDKGTYKWFVWE